MKKSLKAKWLKALRGGRYKQGDGQLRSEDRHYCCLGVLAQIEGARWRGEGTPFIGGRCVADEAGGVMYLSPRLFGLSKKRQEDLGNMNDGCAAWANNKMTFKQIADWIEKKVQAR
jgi:hypothetical protein